ncbi:MAG: efflux RND transporter periplasmic adaptor subunit [Betaproteobacteria bacterium]|nr:efflux RND transporter periplasmic adaptor subunit [Betaproteobacteria bacterium]MBU6511409.1 efflux RND transporter periplasmic adaptor subunit [Betaproteobacteria bacterium]MDE1954680.1 efflux RND transporter periplasmic adaptor subunit [Betaproteobacteria bacterium]MDE2153146.1 efflux RND transporter periplasmic adaptor subunit [Betaproteobacteria bacterium]MDE2477626.1 efflux RND transporter periplasmic adaptor subunit [Betaproteobacteria bacterium]
MLLLALGAGIWWHTGRQAGPAGAGGMRRGAFGAQGPTAVTAASVRVQTVPVWLTALGTVTPHTLASVMPRVSGLLQSVDFHQGQQVRAGQLLATIDPRPFRIAVEQAQATREQTAAQLAGARSDLQRYETLLAQDAISAQQVADQRATVAQLKAQLDANTAALDSARLQLSWTRITAPVSGIAGLRQVDPGNMVNTSGAIGVSSSNTSSSSSSSGSGGGTSGGGGAAPIVTIAQVQPIEVSFALPQAEVGELLRQLAAGRRAQVQAWDASDTRMLAQGQLLAADNQISTSTGTLALRARFANSSLSLLPNQFVNVRVLEHSIADALVVPSTAVAVGANGTYVYVIGSGGAVTVRQIQAGVVWNGLTQVLTGLKPGERVVTAGLDHLRVGARVRVVQAASAPARGASAPRGGASAAGAAVRSGARKAHGASAARPAGAPPANR